jgi:TorA maturation chaperone TorD
MDGKGLDDRLHALTKARTGQILIDHFGLALLAFRHLARHARSCSSM